ncbi:30S ribosomal protein S8 [bacterium]|nr:30S ribosomal protein S8 [bacterium]
MTMSDPLADMLSRVRNGQRAKLAVVEAPSSKLSINVLNVLKDEGYIRDFRVEEQDNKRNIVIDLKYHDGEPVISRITRLSKPGSRMYYGASELPRIHNGLGICVVSTSKGVMSDYQARVQNVGGEVLCSVF